MAYSARFYLGRSDLLPARLMDIIKSILESTTLVFPFVFMIGAAIGSFLNVVIHRLPLMMYKDWSFQCKELQDDPFMEMVPEDHISLATPASRCPKCASPITAFQNIPIFSYLMLGRKCANCSAPISPRYFIVEFCCSLLAVFLAFRYGFTVQTAFYLAFTFMLVPLIFIDMKYKLLPDSITYLILWTGITCSLLGYGITLENSIYGVLVGYLSLWSVYMAFKIITGREGMGHGDFKLIAAIGAWIGWKMLLPALLIASLVGAIISIGILVLSKKSADAQSRAVPFGPYLALGGWITLLWGNELINWYLSQL